jgi:MFS family permease
MINWPDAEVCKRCGVSLVHLSRSKPGVITWYRAYSALMTLLYLFFVVVGIFFLTVAPTDRNMSSEEAQITGGIMFFMGIVLAIPFAIGTFLPQKPWAWVFGLVLICIGLTSVCCMPATIPLLIHWIKPETKFYFGRT